MGQKGARYQRFGHDLTPSEQRFLKAKTQSKALPSPGCRERSCTEVSFTQETPPEVPQSREEAQPSEPFLSEMSKAAALQTILVLFRRCEIDESVNRVGTERKNERIL